MHKSILSVDGKSLEIYSQGLPTDPALILHHGALGSALSMAPIFRAAKNHQLFVVGITRPGYGESTSVPGRRAYQYLEYTSEILDHFDIKSFVSLGWSSGTPAALSDSRDIRCKGAVSISGDAPKANSNWSSYEDKFPAENVTTQYGYTIDLSGNLDRFRNIQQNEIATIFGDSLSVADTEICSGEWGAEFAAGIRRAMEPGDNGLLEDLESDYSLWGFNLDEILVPVAIFQGDEDRLDTPANGRYLADGIPNSELILIKGEGHISLIYKYSIEIVEKALKFLHK